MTDFGPDRDRDPPAQDLRQDLHQDLHQDSRPVVTIRCREDGPLVVELGSGPDGQQAVTLRVTDHRGRAFSLPTHKRAVALCRCGRSGTRPFCDGSHKDCGFAAAELAPEG